MSLERARGLIATQLQFGGGYTREAVRLLPGEVQREHGQGAVDALIRKLDLEQAFGPQGWYRLCRRGTLNPRLFP